MNANTHLSKNFYVNISESPTYSKKYHCQTNIPISSPCTLHIVDVCQMNVPCHLNNDKIKAVDVTIHAIETGWLRIFNNKTEVKERRRNI